MQQSRGEQRKKRADLHIKDHNQAKEHYDTDGVFEELALKMPVLEDCNHHKHRHHHGEWHERAKHLINKKHNGDHQRERRDLEDTLKNNENKQQLYDKLVDSQEYKGKSDTNIRYDAIVPVQHDINMRHTIAQDASKFIGSKASPIVNSVNNKLAVDLQGTLLLGYVLFGKKCVGAKCEMVQDVINEPKDLEYANRRAYSSYAPVIGDNAEEYTE